MSAKLLPDIILPSTNGEVRLDHVKAKFLVLYFYPKDNTPGCTLEGKDFRDHYANFIKLNAVIYGVSRDNLKSHDKFKSECDFPFELISDKNEELCHLYKVIKPKKLYGKEYLGIERSTFLFMVGELIKEWRAVKVEGHVKEILKEIKKHVK